MARVLQIHGTNLDADYNAAFGTDYGYNVGPSRSPSFDMGAVSQAGGGEDLQRLIARQAANDVISKIINVTPESIPQQQSQPSAVERLVRTITAPKISRSISRPVLNEAVRTGNITGSDNQVDLVRAILNPPKNTGGTRNVENRGR